MRLPTDNSAFWMAYSGSDDGGQMDFPVGEFVGEKVPKRGK